MNNNQPPLLFEKFEIIETLKKDEHSAVYRAMHIFLGVEIILKTLDTSNLPDPSILERFKREAKILARLKHPNVINVLDFGMHMNFFYISFEYFESKNLREYIKDRNIPVEQKKALFIQLLLGVRAAHAMQVIHRDIKPENILVNSRFELKIADFGLAFAEADSMVTQKASIVGTPTYMSPEQICGEQLTVQSDLFALGIVGFELFTSVNPFVKADISATINSILNFDDSIFAALEKLPEDVAAAIKGLLQKSKSKRFLDCATALDRLGYIPGKVSHPHEINKAAKIHRYIFIAAALMAVMIIALFFIMNGKDDNKTAGIVTADSTANNIVSADNSKKTDSAPVEPAQIINKVEEKKPAVQDEKNSNAETESGIIRKVEMCNVHLAIDCSPWANVYVDSQKIDVTPVNETLKLLTGQHTIRLVHPEYPVYSTVIKVTAEGNYNFKINLDTLAGKVVFNVFPWADIFIDGIASGQTPLKKPVIVSPGKHIIRLSNPSFPEYSEQIFVKRGETSVFSYTFNKAKN